MKNFIVGTIAGITGVITGFIAKSLLDKRTDESKTVLDSSLDSDIILDTFDNIENIGQRKQLLDMYFELIIKGYHSDSSEEVQNINTKIQILLKNSGILGKLSSDIFCNDINQCGDDDTNEEKKTNVYKVDDESNKYKEVIDDEYCASEVYLEDVSEGEQLCEPEEDVECELSEEIESFVQSSEDVSLEEDEDEFEELEDEDHNDEQEEPEDEEPVDNEQYGDDNTDDEKFSILLNELVRPLMDKFGDTYEDRLVRMCFLLSQKGIPTSVYDDYITRLSSVLKFQTGEKGKKKLNMVVSNFFSIYPPDADPCNK